MALRYFLLLSAAFFLFRCSGKPEKPEHLIPEKSYTRLLVELQLVRSYSKRIPLDSLATDSLTNRVFKKYNVSNEQFQQSHHYYQQFPKKQLQRIDKAIEDLKEDRLSDTPAAREVSLDQEQVNYFYYQFHDRRTLNPLIIRPRKRLRTIPPSIYIYRHHR